MTPFFSFFIILLVAVIFSQLFLRMKIPWVVALIIGGMIVGPSGLELFEIDVTMDFLASIGLVFLMFMAGLESRFTEAKGKKIKIAISSIFIGLIPACVGFLIGLVFDYSWETSILLGIIFMSSAIALLIPQFQAQKMIGSDLGKTIINTAIVVDATSLILLSIFLQFVTNSISWIILIIYPFLILLMWLIGWMIPRVKWLVFDDEYAEEQDLFEKELRFVILILIGFVVLFELVGLHAIIAGFFAGLVLSRSIKSRLLKAKLNAVGYGFFVPIFFVVIGSTVDVSAFTENFNILTLIVAIILGLSISKFISGWLAGKIVGFGNRESAFFGSSVIPQLSTALAVAFLGVGQGIMDQNLLFSIVVLSITTSIISPIIVSILGKKLTVQHVSIPEAHEEPVE